MDIPEVAIRIPMNKEETIKALLPSEEIIKCTIRYTDTSPWTVNVDVGNEGFFQSEREDLFEAFINIREQLHEKDIFLLCNGSRRNIYPSPMLRQSDGGKKAYLLRPGVPARKEDIVNIFGSIERNDLDTDESQKGFYDQWLNSLDPTSKEIEEAKNHPNGWVYRIDGDFSDDQSIPPTAIIGAWEVNSDGKLTNTFNTNKKYSPSHPA